MAASRDASGGKPPVAKPKKPPDFKVPNLDQMQEITSDLQTVWEKWRGLKVIFTVCDLFNDKKYLGVCFDGLDWYTMDLS